MKKLIINLLPIKSGGGLQNALGFLKTVDNTNFICLVNEGSPLHEICKENNIRHYSVKGGILNRIIFEAKFRSIANKGDVCFTYFGPPLFSCVNYTYNINGFAYSNLLYPEVDFWKWFKLITRIKKKLIDCYRSKMMSYVDELIFETDLLKERALELGKFNKVKKLHVVKMSPTYYGDMTRISVSNKKLNGNNSIRVLYLCGDQPNKRVGCISNLIEVASKYNYPIEFITTVSDAYFKKTFKYCSKDILDKITNIGPVPQSEIPNVISGVDAMINIAVLESFSNNCVEAWSYERCLIITDADWSRRSCGGGAIYVDIETEESIRKCLNSLFDINTREKCISNGKKILASLPTLEQKNSQYMTLIKRSLM